MVFRPDVSVNWAVSPRIITVAAPSVTISVQDLVDTLRTLEAQMLALDDYSLLDATGKDSLGVDKAVGITLRLNDAKVAFEARMAPPYVQCIVDGGNLIAVDALGNIMSPVEPTAFTQVVIEQSTSPTLVYASGGSPEDIADAVWDELALGHTGAGKAGAQLWTNIDAIGAKTVNLPANPASEVTVLARPTLAQIEASAVLTNIQSTIDFVRRSLTNKMNWDAVLQRWDIYDDAGVVIILHMQPSDPGGLLITMPAGSIAQRTKVAP